MMKLISGKNVKLTMSSEIVENIENGRKIANKMLVFLNKYPNGCGLSAVQVGILKRIFVIRYRGIIKKVINPEILEKSKDTTKLEEGCLSFPNKFKKIKRSNTIKVKYNDGKNDVIEYLNGYVARIFQHEYDHLNGKLCVV